MKNSHRWQILKLLKEKDEFMSGQDLCDFLGISRTAVWKAVKQLKEEGYEIESVPNRGYHMVGMPDIITPEEIKSLLKTRELGREICCYEKVDSTNTMAKKLAESEGIHGLLVTADVQSAGKGRRGKHWESQPGTGVWMTLLLRPDIAPENASMLTLTAALAVSDAIRETTDLQSYIKWPNDIIVNGKKVCGILTEMSSEADYINYIIIGIGINVNMEEFPDSIKDIASSLFLEGGKKIHRSTLIAAVLEHFEPHFEAFLQNQSIKAMREEYNKQLINCNKKVKIMETGREYTAVALGVDELGRLLVELPDGEQKAVVSGEVSVRGLYGYIR